MSGAGPRGRGRARGRPAAEASAQQAPGPQIGQDAAQDGAPVGRGVVGRRATVTPAAATAEFSDEKKNRSPPSSEFVDKMESLELTSVMSRPGFGTLGRKYRMYANHFELALSDKALTVNRYDIEIKHPATNLKLNRDDNRAIFWKCLLKYFKELGLPSQDSVYRACFDGVKNCFTLDPLQLDRGGLKVFTVEASVTKCDRMKPIEVQLKNVGQVVVDLGAVHLSERTSTEPIQVIDLLLRQYRSQPYSDVAKMFYPHKSTVFTIPGGPNAPGGVDLGGGREVWKGLFTSAHVVEGNRAMVNMDVDHTAFYKFATNGDYSEGGKYSVIQYMCDVLNDHERCQRYSPSQLSPDSDLTPFQKSVFKREIKGLRVTVDHGRAMETGDHRTYGVKDLGVSAADCVFTKKDGTTQSVASYFADTYGPLKYPRMFTLKGGSTKKPINLPIEHCFLVKCQKVMKKLTENQTANMIRQTCMAPADRKRSIEQMVQLSRFNEDPYLKNFGIRVNPQMSGVEGRVLPQPSLMYGGNQQIAPRDGVWRPSGARFHMPAEAKGIAVVGFGRTPNSSDKFIGDLLGMCRNTGMKMPATDQIYWHNETDQTAQRVEIAFRNIMDCFEKHSMQCDLIIVFLPVKGGSLYSEVKRVGEIQMGIMTQCIVAKTVERSSPDTLLNIAFKINMKLGGVCCAVTAREQAARYFSNAATLVLGIDVTHPGPTEHNKPSVASVVGSMDLTQMRYGASIKVQKERKENLVYVCDAVTERLMAFYKCTQQKPERIIVYRDGVSQGQFIDVLKEELLGVRQACRQVDPNYKPKITFIVVQKRHHTRLFPSDPNDGCGKHKNVYPGSIVDNRIVNADEFVFYLCSHAGIQGTSRPTRYYVLHDESTFSADDIQLITYYLCHCFSRCARSVSIPAPVYYADLACTRARVHLSGAFGDTMSDTESTTSGGERKSSGPSEGEMIKATTLEESIRKTMYFT